MDNLFYVYSLAVKQGKTLVVTFKAILLFEIDLMELKINLSQITFLLQESLENNTGYHYAQCSLLVSSSVQYWQPRTVQILSLF